MNLVKREQYLNPQISVINGREYTTKLGKATQVQVGLNDLKKLVETCTQIIQKLEENMPEEESQNNEASE